MTCDGASYVGSEREPTALEKNGMCGGSVQGAIARQGAGRIMLALDWQATG